MARTELIAGILFLLALAFVSYHAPRTPRTLRRMEAKMKPIKLANDRSVWAVDGDHVRHFIPDWNTFVSNGFDIAQIVTVSLDEMNSYPEGEPLELIEELPEQPESCPCSQSKEYEETMESKKAAIGDKICLVRSPSAVDLRTLSSEDGIAWVPGIYNRTYFRDLNMEIPAELKRCSVVIEIGDTWDDSISKYECPEQCLPLPFSFIPLSWLLIHQHSHVNPTFRSNLEARDFLLNRFDPHRPITCSMTFNELLGGDVRNLAHHRSALNFTAAEILYVIAKRRFQECYEEPYWRLFDAKVRRSVANSSSLVPSSAPLSVPSLAIDKRSVHGLLIWVGSTTRYDLMQRQIQILRNQSAPPTSILAGWMASEAQYGCRVGSALCISASSSNSYYPGMPQTRMNMAAAGWSCAQRRPLRSLAHVLRLYSPTYILLADDDTFFSWHILQSAKFDHYVRQELVSHLFVLGQLSNGRKVTRRGFFYGGAGYLFGKMVIDRLTSEMVYGPDAPSTGMLDSGQTAALAVLYEAERSSQKICPRHCIGNYSSISEPKLPSALLEREMTNHWGLRATAQVRLIDICIHLMALEHTCYHSDHSMSRCLVHGAYAGPVHIECGGSTIGAEDWFVGMCMGTAECNPKVHLTCHRWHANPLNPLAAKPGT